MLIKKALWVSFLVALVAASALAFFEKRKVTVESNDGKRVYRRVAHVGTVRLVKRLSDKPCVYGISWGYDRDGIWVDRGCRAEFEYQTSSGGSRVERVRVESNDGKRVYKRVDTSGGVRLVKRLSTKPCVLNRSWGYDRNGIWVDDGCRAEFEVRRDNGSGGIPEIVGNVPRWAIGTWRSYRNSGGDYELTIRTDGVAYLRKKGDVSEGQRGDAGSDRIRFGNKVYELAQDGRDRIKFVPVTGTGVWHFERK